MRDDSQGERNIILEIGPEERRKELGVPAALDAELSSLNVRATTSHNGFSSLRRRI